MQNDVEPYVHHVTVEGCCQINLLKVESFSVLTKNLEFKACTHRYRSADNRSCNLTCICMVAILGQSRVREGRPPGKMLQACAAFGFTNRQSIQNRHSSITFHK